jgi:homoserine O-acetyltransferase/O-succinyltransferase
MTIRALFATLLLLAAAPAAAQTAQTAQTPWPNLREGDFVLKDFVFASGEVLPELKLHYRTLGTAKRNAAGEIVNGVVLLHGTSGSGADWLRPSLADELFGAGQPLDTSKYFIIVPDGIGRGGSSKPSDGLRAKFPHYRYHDIVTSQHRLVTEHLNVRHLRLVLGSSMGGMHSWMWGYMFPDLMDGIVPIASQPIQVSGRNWIQRRIAIEAIRNDPDWNGGNYTKNPSHYIYTVPYRFVQTENIVQIQNMAPTRAAADELYNRLVEAAKRRDANDVLWGIEAVMDYDPGPHLEKIKAKLLAINFGDDGTNAPELGTLEAGVKRIKNARYVIVPGTKETHGHFTHLRAKFWAHHLAEFMKELGE